VSRPLVAVPTERARALRGRRVMVLLAVLAMGAVVAFMTVGVTGSWEYALQARSRRLAGMVLVGVAIAVSTVLFQTVTNNRILTPSVMGFDALFVLLQTTGVFFLGAATVTGADPRVRFAVEVVALVAFGAALYRLLFGRTRHDLYVLVLLGVVLGTLFTSLTLLVSRLIDPNDFLTLQDLLFASFNGINRQLLGVSAVVVVVTVAASSGCSPGSTWSRSAMSRRSGWASSTDGWSTRPCSPSPCWCPWPPPSSGRSPSWACSWPTSPARCWARTGMPGPCPVLR
jgi:iron complex transport system permease protein